MKVIEVGDLRIAFENKGTGIPLVLLHGALSDSRIWRNQFEGLANDFAIVAWDAPGCGQSSDPPESYSLTDFAKCLATLIDQLDLDHPHILGLSFGSGLALEFYRNYPEIPRSLVLASAYAGWAGSLPSEEVEERLQNGLKQSKLPPEQVVNTWLPTLFSKSTPEEVINECARIMSDFHPAGMRAMLRAFAKADLRDVLPNIKVPTLLLYGDADQRSPLHIAKELHASIPTSQLVIMQGVGHEGNIEAPEIFNAEIRHFLKSIQT